MTKLLVSPSNPDGDKIEDVLRIIRGDIITRCNSIIDDRRPEAERVVENNIEILQLLSEAISLAEDSTKTLDKSFGPSVSNQGGPPRIGTK
jgi:hypothetical protein